MSNLPKDIRVIFDNNPMLNELIPNPVLVSDSPFVSALYNNLSIRTKGSGKDDLYKIVFKKDSSRDLMTINSGELKGLLTSTCIEKGKISDVAGLKRVEIDNESDLMPTLLGISLYGSIQNSLSYISQLYVDIRNHQIIEEQARFERISEVIVDSFGSIPDLSLNRSMRDIYLNRIINNTDDCYEIYIAQRQRFIDLLSSEPRYYSTGYSYYFTDNNGHQINPCQFFEQKVLNHSVFSVFERLVAGTICQIIISGNYSDSNIRRHKDFISRVQGELEKLMEYRLKAFHNFTEEHKNKIDTDLNLSSYDRKRLNEELDQHRRFVKRISQRIFDLLGSKLDSFDILLHLMDQDEIDIFLIDGKLLVNSSEYSPNKALQRTSR